jgi:hypothetical protein
MSSHTTILGAGSIPAPQEPAAGDNYLTHGHGLRSWLLTLDHKRIGVMYLISIMSAFLLGGILAMLIRAELLGPKATIMQADTYNRVFTLHGAVMIFLFIIPGIPAALGNFVLRSCSGQGRGLPVEPVELVPRPRGDSPSSSIVGGGGHRLTFYTPTARRRAA